MRDLRAAIERLNPDLAEAEREQAIEKLTRSDFARSLIQHNREFCSFIRGGVPVVADAGCARLAYLLTSPYGVCRRVLP